MSLDVYLRVENPIKKPVVEGVFVRENGSTKQISIEEWNSRFPDQEAFKTVSNEDEEETNEVYSANITHNLRKMASAAGIYETLWRPDEIGIETASQLIEPLQAGLKKLKSEPYNFKQYNPANGWGDYGGFVKFVERYLKACEEYPDATVSVSR